MPETHLALTLQTLLAANPNTNALRSGELRSPLVDFVFADVKTVNKAFKPLVREQKFDLASPRLPLSHFCKRRPTASRTC
jgi:hypothetical protein